MYVKQAKLALGRPTSEHLFALTYNQCQRPKLLPYPSSELRSSETRPFGFTGPFVRCFPTQAWPLTRSRDQGTLQTVLRLTSFTSINSHQIYFKKDESEEFWRNQQNVGCTFILQSYRITTWNNMGRLVQPHVKIVSTKLQQWHTSATPPPHVINNQYPRHW